MAEEAGKGWKRERERKLYICPFGVSLLSIKATYPASQCGMICITS